MKRALIVTTTVALAGCATTDYAQQLAVYREVETARATADAERYRALAALAKDGDSSTRQVALQAWQAVAMAESLSGGTGGPTKSAIPAPPPTAMDRAMQALGVVAPIAVQAYGLHTGYRLGVRQSDNAATIALGDQRARVDSIAAITSGMGALGAAGFDALAHVGVRPSTSITVTGADNVVAAGGAATRTTTNNTNCPANGGNATTPAQGGTGGSGTGGSTGTGASGVASGAGAAGGTANATGTVGASTTNCVAGGR